MLQDAPSAMMRTRRAADSAAPREPRAEALHAAQRVRQHMYI